ncbi:MAG: outer membrane beta-barrel protein [Vicinamibacterales bacterium]
MRRSAACLLLGALCILAASRPASAQDEPSRIGPIAIDVRGSFPGLSDSPTLAASRNLVGDELPGRGLGGDVGAHLYLFKAGAVTFGIGAQLTLIRGTSQATEEGLRAVTSRLVSFTPQVSLNFGSGDGWSYLSAGMGQSEWSIVVQGEAPTSADLERLRTFNYGGGARWFMNEHVAFTFDVRFHVIEPGAIHVLGLPGSPRTRLLVIGAGLSFN